MYRQRVGLGDLGVLSGSRERCAKSTKFVKKDSYKLLSLVLLSVLPGLCGDLQKGRRERISKFNLSVCLNLEPNEMKHLFA